MAPLCCHRGYERTEDAIAPLAQQEMLVGYRFYTLTLWSQLRLLRGLCRRRGQTGPITKTRAENTS
jgi:hypothetical protein